MVYDEGGTQMDVPIIFCSDVIGRSILHPPPASVGTSVGSLGDAGVGGCGLTGERTQQWVFEGSMGVGVGTQARFWATIWGRIWGKGVRTAGHAL